MTEYVRGGDGRILGWFDTQADTTWLRGSDGIILGWYTSSDHITRDRHGRIVAYGNALAMLLTCQGAGEKR